MQKEVIAQRTRSYIVEDFLFGQADEFQDSDSFLEGGILDSTGILQLIAFLQENFNITIDDEEVTPDNLDSIEIIVDFVIRKQKGTPGDAAEVDQEAREGTNA